MGEVPATGICLALFLDVSKLFIFSFDYRGCGFQKSLETVETLV